jgi:thiol-disulfide isomerase/thioredoxin
MQNNPLLNQLAFDIVKDKVIEDKTKMYMEEQEKKQKEEIEKQKNELDDLDEIDSEEERIMQQEMEKMRKTAESKREDMAKRVKTEKYGNYTEIIETEFLDTMLKNDKVVCHFYHKDFERCKIIDKHLQIIAQQHRETLFVKINAEKTPFFTAKLNVRVLPTIILFVKGKSIHRFIGFQDFGMNDDFPTINLARQLVIFKMIEGKTKAERGEISIRKTKKDDSDDED